MLDSSLEGGGVGFEQEKVEVVHLVSLCKPLRHLVPNRVIFDFVEDKLLLQVLLVELREPVAQCFLFSRVFSILQVRNSHREPLLSDPDVFLLKNSRFDSDNVPLCYLLQVHHEPLHLVDGILTLVQDLFLTDKVSFAIFFLLLILFNFLFFLLTLLFDFESAKGKLIHGVGAELLRLVLPFPHLRRQSGFLRFDFVHAEEGVNVGVILVEGGSEGVVEAEGRSRRHLGVMICSGWKRAFGSLLRV